MPARLAPLLAALVLAGCLGAAPEAPSTADFGMAHTDHADVEDLAFNFTGTIRGTPVAPGVVDLPFDVPKGATGIAATLTWPNAPVAALRLTLLTPRGEEAGRGFPESPGRQSVATLDPPPSGEWIARVESSRALDEPFEVAVVVSFLVPRDNVLADEVEVAAGDFVEVNLIMEGGASFAWAFDATGDLEWNVHSHESGRTIYHEEGAGASHEGNFTAPKRQIYSILWESLAPSPIRLSYKVEGAFRVHSHSQ